MVMVAFPETIAEDDDTLAEPAEDDGLTELAEDELAEEL